MGLFGGSSSHPRAAAPRARPRRPRPVAGQAQPPGPPTEREAPIWGNPAITVLMAEGAGFDRARLAAALGAAWPDLGVVVERGFGTHDLPGSGDPAKDEAMRRALAEGWSEDAPLSTVRIAGLGIRCMHMDMPAPGTGEMIQTTRTDRAVLGAAIGSHRGHILCLSDAPPERGVEATAHLFRIAAALAEQGALGIIHTSAWQAFAIGHVRDQLAADNLEALTGKLFPLVWCNCIPFHGEGGSWMTSKGYSVAGVPDITMWTTGQAEADAARDFLPNLFWYLKKGAVLRPGETIQMQGSSANYRIGRVSEYRDYLCGPGETIALRPV